MAELSGLDVHYLVNELQILVNSKVENIYQWDKKEFMIRFKSFNGKFDLMIELPSLIYVMSKPKETLQEPPGFCTQLRKKFKGAIIKDIHQKGFERIIVFVDQNNNKLVLELFKPGNLILVDSEDKILQVLNHRTFKDRSLRPNQEYVFPPVQNDTKILSSKEIDKIISSSDKELGITLATQLGFGGKYANELAIRAQVKKSVMYNDLSDSEKKMVLKEVKKIFEEDLVPNISNKKPFPIKMVSLDASESIQTKSFSEALEKTNVQIDEKKDPVEIIKLKKMISSQEKATNQLEKEIDENTSIGEFIYSNFQELEKFMNQAKQILDSKDKDKFKEFLESKKGFVEYNKKEKIIIFDF